MLRSFLFFCLISIIGLTNLTAQDTRPQVSQIGEDIQLVRLTENTFIHRSYKVFDGYGRIGSNGLIYIVDSTCIVFDTPVTLKTTTYLLDYLQNTKGLEVKAVVVNHFHEDCVAGLDSVHARGIPSYGTKKTIELATLNDMTAPQQKMGKRKKFKVGGQKATTYYPGPAHTVDNIVAYIPAEKVLFGGCMLKSYGATTGNLNDADLVNWPKSAAKVKKKFSDAEIFIPGHGHHGGVELLDYTIDLFTK